MSPRRGSSNWLSVEPNGMRRGGRLVVAADEGIEVVEPLLPKNREKKLENSQKAELTLARLLNALGMGAAAKRRQHIKQDSRAKTNEAFGAYAIETPWLGGDPVSQNPNGDPQLRKRTLSTTRRPSVLSMGLKQIRTVSKSVRSMAENELKFEALRFAHTTTAHGIPMALNARACYGKTIWVMLSLCSLTIFFYQCFWVLQKYHRKDKIVNVELQFEPPHYPSVTVCNLNPFKKHLARTVPQISETLDAWHAAVVFSKDANQRLETMIRSRRQAYPGAFQYVQFEPVMSDCACKKSRKSNTYECTQKDSIPKDNRTMCICNYDRQDSTAWPCYPSVKWEMATCPDCNDIGYCNLPGTVGSANIPCICQKDVKYCLLRPERMKRLWEVRGSRIPDEDSPFRADFLSQLKELGYENMTDEVAITTKTKEKCDIINDFKLHVDPAFGNCYTFNASPSKNLTSTRAGPSYGLRLLIYINTTDYLPTTQAMGVRIAIHGKREYPFPDTFGYMAPTGQVSSFGMAMRKVHRLPLSGDCVTSDEPLPPWYIYRDYKYEPENRIIQRCGCADPRYPVARNETKLCDRSCLLRESTRFTRSHLCPCRHPCEHEVYTTTYSSARLTSDSFASRCDGRDCFERFEADSLVMLEIYYEQMSYESLTEREAYSFVNFLSDVGGQAGLWLGASVITLFEFAYFVFRLMTLVCRARQPPPPDSQPPQTTERQNSTTDTIDEIIPPKAKHSTNGIKFTVTPAQSVEDLRGFGEGLAEENTDSDAVDSSPEHHEHLHNVERHRPEIV